jgi:hypothetical protein
MKERSLYPSVVEFLGGKDFGCFKTATRVGTSYVGIADVVGAREIGGDVRGDLEVVAVEVKTTSGNFGKILGQALGYSLLAHRCYLAIPFSKGKTFTIEQKELATRLGVGLLEIRKRQNTWKCHQVLTSANHTPHGHQMETLLRRGLHLVRCGLCAVFTDSKSFTEWKRALEQKKTYLAWRLEPDRRLLFSRRRNEEYRRLYLCKDCVQELSKKLEPDIAQD